MIALLTIGTERYSGMSSVCSDWQAVSMHALATMQKRRCLPLTPFKNIHHN